MEDWITSHKLPIGKYIEAGINWLTQHAAGFFNFILLVLGTVIDGLTHILLLVPALVLLALIGVATFLFHRSWRLALFVVLALLLVMNLGYWQAMVETLSLVISATAFCVIVGVPAGVAAAHRPWLYAAIRPVLDLMQTIPTFVYLIPTIYLFGLGTVPGLISTVVFAIPAPIRLTHLGVSSTPRDLIEAGLAFGASRRQLLWKVELPYAFPTIMAGVTQCIMLCLSMVVIAALVGADGLGKPVVRALNQLNIPMGFESGLAIVILAIILDRVLKRPERRKVRT